MGTLVPAVQVASVSAGYSGKEVFSGFSIEAAAGEMIGLLGPNGAGKTTLLRCITGRCRPARGEVRLFGQPVAAMDPASRARAVAVVPQELDMPLPFTVEETVRIGRTAVLPRWSGPSRRDDEAVERAMAYTDVADFRGRRFSELSGGEKQRVLVALALAQESRIVLMDEATSHLDFNHRIELMQLVERLNREHGVTVLLTSHDINLAAEFCQRLVLLDGGKVYADGRPAEVLTAGNLRHVYRCHVRIQSDPATGSLTVLPAPRLTGRESGRGARVHVIAGGGCGEAVIRHLVLCGYAVSAGVLNRGDSDAIAAAALGAATVLERPFSPIEETTLAEAKRLASDAVTVVLSAVPFGTGNVPNLTLAEDAIASGRRVLIVSGVENRDYTPDRQAARRVAELVARGALLCQTETDIFDHIPAGSQPTSR
jgi:iron complex transport system ATP-binding protein